jgi:hypothetical protein
MLRAHQERSDAFTGREPLELRHCDVDDEVPAASQVRSRVAEALDLLVLRREVGDRVPHDVDDVECAVHSGGRAVPDRGTDLIGARLGEQLPDHRSGQVDAVHPRDTLTQRQCDPAGR